ncbi:hypothetical protein HN011_002050 [Eciton burchellii]|nr:hypothetical protein HN011_002050 [Eciton burchellii]
MTEETDGNADFGIDQSRSTDACPLTFHDKCFANKPQVGARETLDDGRQRMSHFTYQGLGIHVQLDKPTEEVLEIGDKVQLCCAISIYEARASGEKLSSWYIFIFIERTRRVPLREAIDVRHDVSDSPCSLSPSFADEHGAFSFALHPSRDTKRITGS